MLEVITWKWTPPASYRSQFKSRHVNVAARMVAKHYPYPHRFSCITDDPKGIDPNIRVIPLPNHYANLRNPSYSNGPNCYRRLIAYDRQWALENIGPRFVSLDLDFVAVGDLGPLWNRQDDFMIWGDTMIKTDIGVRGYNGSMFMMNAGARQNIWDDFDPRSSPMLANRAGCKGSDQGWITYKLGAGQKTWTLNDGVVSWRKHIKNGGGKLPTGARIVFFHGLDDPWGRAAQQQKWVQDNWK